MDLDELKKISKALVAFPGVLVGTMAADAVLSVLAENGIEPSEPLQVLVYLIISGIVAFIVWRIPNKPDVELVEHKADWSKLNPDWSVFEEENKKNDKSNS